MLICIGDGAKHAAGAAHGYYAAWDILCDDAACADDGIRTYGNAGKDGDVCAEPDVIAYGDRQGDLKTCVALRGIYGVCCGSENAVGGDEYVVAEGYGCAVKQHEVIVGVEALAECDVYAVVAVKGCGYYGAALDLADYPAQEGGFGGGIAWLEVIVLKAQVVAGIALFEQRCIVIGILEIACLRLFPFCHSMSFRLWYYCRSVTS